MWKKLFLLWKNIHKNKKLQNNYKKMSKIFKNLKTSFLPISLGKFEKSIDNNS